jgi:nitrogenase molybdenum-iron protein alpha chain
MSAEYENDGAFNEKLIEEVLAAYPEKFAKRRRKHLTVAKAAGEEEAAAEDGKVASECEVKSNIKSTTNSPTISALLRVGRMGPIK